MHSYRKNMVRTLGSTKSRFIAIFAIVALGVGFLAGLMATPIDMTESMEEYLDSANLYDLRVVSTLGLTDDDVAALKAVDGVKDVQPAYSADLLVQAGDTDVIVARAHSLPENAAGELDADDTINRLLLVDGRWPENPGECVVEAGANSVARGFAIGSTFTATAANEDLDTKLAQTEYTVVGTVRSAYYFSFEREPASVGNGTVSAVFYLQPSDFSYEAYTEIYLTADDALTLDSLSDEYADWVQQVDDAVEDISGARCDARYDGIISDAQAEIDDAWAEYNDAKEEADTELADAAQELADGRQELEDGEQELADAEVEYADGAAELAENEQAIQDAVKQLQSARDQLTEGQAAYEDGMRQIKDAEEQLNAGRLKLEDGERQYNAGKATYDASLAQIEAGESQLADAKAQLDSAQAQYDAGKATYETALAQVESGESQLADAKTRLDSAQAQYDAGKATYETALAQVESGESQLADAKARLDDAQAQYDAGKATYETALAQVESGEAQLADAKTQLDDAQVQYDAGAQQLDSLKQLNSGEKAYADGTAQLADSVSAMGLTVTQERVDAYVRGLAAQDDSALPQTDLGVILGLLMTGQTDTANAAAFAAATPETAASGQLAAAVRQLVEARRTLDAGLDAMVAAGAAADRDAAKALISDESIAALETRLAASKAQLDEGWAEYNANAAALADARAQLEVQAPQLEAAKAQLETGWAEYNANAAALADARAQLEAQAPQLEAAKVQLDEGWAEYNAGAATLADARAQLEAQAPQLEAAKAQLDEGWAQYSENAAVLAAGRAQLEASAPQLEDAKRQLETGWAEYNASGALVYENLNTLRDSKKTLDDGWATLTDKQVELDDAQRQIAEARQTLADARAELDEAYDTIAENRQKLLDGETEYADAKAEADEKLADAKAEIEDAQSQLDDVEYPEWYVWDRTDNVSFNSFKTNVAKLEAITTIFPVFFFLVAALVVSTTMSRMVEEERLQIGTMKALGYTAPAIAKKYLFYALAASLAGTVFGLSVGFVAFPKVIWSAYEMMYWMPTIHALWRWGLALAAGGLLIGGSVLVTLFTCQTTLREVPAALMRPRAPKAGKRILLERIGFVWRRLPFSYKVTCRNLMRYKKRFWMTVIGVAGCTSLLVAGFGISDSLNAIITKQYSDVYKYQLLTIVTDETDTESGEVYDYLFTGDAFTESLAVSMEKAEQDSDSGTVESYLMVPRDVAAFADFADLHERISRDATPLGETGVVLTEKLANTLGVQAGDTVTLKNNDGTAADFTVTGVCEHYVSNYIYMSAATYTAGFGEAPSFNAVISLMPDDSQATRDAVSADLLDMDSVASLTFTQDSITTVLNMLTSIDAVVVLIIVCAACLAFVVLYNLSNINIAERVKEIATIKVLGFYDRETNAYVNRESVALTVIGAVFGLFGGKALHTFVIRTVEVDAVMFGRQIEPVSYLYAFALTLVFGFTVNLVMGRKLKKISMVESMKAPE